MINGYCSCRYEAQYWLLSLAAKDEYFYDEYDGRDMYGKKYSSIPPKEKMISFFISYFITLN
jgi:hypothetical protein